MVLGAGRIEVGEKKERAAEAVQPRVARDPTLLGGPIQAIDRAVVQRRRVLKSEVAVPAAVVLDLDPQPGAHAAAEALGKREVDVVGGLVGGQTRAALALDEAPHAVSAGGDVHPALRPLALDDHLELRGVPEQACEAATEAGEDGVHRSNSAVGATCRVEAMRSAQRSTRQKTSSRPSKASETPRPPAAR